jgi:hypothetical protein
MADLVTYGPWTLYKSPEYDAAVKQQQLDAEMERKTKQLQQDLLRSTIEKAQKEQEFLQSPAGQEQAQLEAEKIRLNVEKLKSEIADQKEKAMKASPTYAPLEAARLAGVQSKLKSDLETQQGLLSDVQNRISSLKSASAPLPAGVAGPVMERDMATRMMRPALDVEASMQQMVPGTTAALGATQKQLGELVGTVPIPENLGGGTAPATSDISSIYKERFEKLVPMKAQGIAYINSLQPGSDERVAAEQTFGKMTGYEDAQTKKAAENALKIPGLEGMATTEKGAKDMRDRLPEFVSAVGSIDELVKIGEEARGSVIDRPILMARADAIRTALFGQMRLALGGPGTQTEQDVERLKQAIPDTTSILAYSANNRLAELKKVLARKITADARANGYQVKSIQSIIDANSAPSDIETFGARKNVAPEKAQGITNKQQSFASEAEARAAGFKDGEEVIVNGGRFILQQD